MTTRQIHTHCVRSVATVVGIVLLGTLANGPAAVADLIPGEAMMITVEASNGEDSGQLSWKFPPGLVIAGRYDWSLPEAASIHAGGKALGTVDSLTLSIDAQ